jgi:hypothetical protein
MGKQRERIQVKRATDKVKVNQDFVDELLNNTKKNAKEVIDDSRFQQLFEDDEFKMDANAKKVVSF